MPYPYKFKLSEENGIISLTPATHHIQKNLDLSRIEIYYQIGLIQCFRQNTDQNKEKKESVEGVTSIIADKFIEKNKENEQFVTKYTDGVKILSFGVDKWKSNQLMIDFIECLENSIYLTGNFIGSLKELLQSKGYNIFNKKEPSFFNASVCPFKITYGRSYSSDLSIKFEEAIAKKIHNLKEIRICVNGEIILNLCGSPGFDFSEYILNDFKKEDPKYKDLVFKDNGDHESLYISLDSFDMTEYQKNQIVIHFIKSVLGVIALKQKDIDLLKEKLLKQLKIDFSSIDNKNYYTPSKGNQFSLFSSSDMHFKFESESNERSLNL